MEAGPDPEEGRNNEERPINHSANGFPTCGYCLPRTPTPAAERRIITNNNNSHFSGRLGSVPTSSEGRTRPLALLK